MNKVETQARNSETKTRMLKAYDPGSFFKTLLM